MIATDNNGWFIESELWTCPIEELREALDGLESQYDHDERNDLPGWYDVWEEWCNVYRILCKREGREP